MSTATVTYDEVKDLPNHPETYLIDVRDPPEIKDTGLIPTSFNIPREYESVCVCVCAYHIWGKCTNLSVFISPDYNILIRTLCVTLTSD